MAFTESNVFVSCEEPSEFSRHGSIRKVLHSLVGTDSLLGKSAKMLDRPKSKLTSGEPEVLNYCVKEYAIISEYNMVVLRRIPGLYVIPSANSALLWFGVLFIRSGAYKGGVFRFTLLIPEEYPHCSCPSLIFETRIFHPLIDSETFELNLEIAFSQWSKDVNHIWQVLDFARNSFYNIPTDCGVDQLAAYLYKNDHEEFLRQVAICVEKSHNDIYNAFEIDDEHSLKFSKYDENIHGETLRVLKSPKKCKPSLSSGLSWVKRGSLKPCSAKAYF